MTDNTEGKIKMIKGIVFFMTALMVLGLILIVYGVVAGKSKEEEAIVAAEQKAIDPITVRSDVKTTIKSMMECGEMLCVAISSKEMESILIVNPKTGKLQGNVNLVQDKNIK